MITSIGAHAGGRLDTGSPACQVTTSAAPLRGADGPSPEMIPALALAGAHRALAAIAIRLAVEAAAHREAPEGAGAGLVLSTVDRAVQT
jgi:hypothetical protein